MIEPQKQLFIMYIVVNACYNDCFSLSSLVLEHYDKSVYERLMKDKQRVSGLHSRAKTVDFC